MWRDVRDWPESGKRAENKNSSSAYVDRAGLEQWGTEKKLPAVLHRSSHDESGDVRLGQPEISAG